MEEYLVDVLKGIQSYWNDPARAVVSGQGCIGTYGSTLEQLQLRVDRAIFEFENKKKEIVQWQFTGR